MRVCKTFEVFAQANALWVRYVDQTNTMMVKDNGCYQQALTLIQQSKGAVLCSWRLIDSSCVEKANRLIVMPLVQKYGLALQYVSDKLRNDRDVVLAAVRQNGDALQYASGLLQEHPEVKEEARLQKFLARSSRVESQVVDRELQLTIRDMEKVREQRTRDLMANMQKICAKSQAESDAHIKTYLADFKAQQSKPQVNTMQYVGFFAVGCLSVAAAYVTQCYMNDDSNMVNNTL